MAKYILLILLSANPLLTTNVMASPVNHLTKIGEGEMTYLFWNLYLAELYIAPSAKTKRPVLTSNDSKGKALKITYFKSISKRDLIDATQDQWEHLGYANRDIQRWLKPLGSLWPDVEPGDKLTLVVSDDGKSQFYFDDKSIGTIDDISFGQAFLSIWLSENTTEPELRKQLLGLNR